MQFTYNTHNTITHITLTGIDWAVEDNPLPDGLFCVFGEGAHDAGEDAVVPVFGFLVELAVELDDLDGLGVDLLHLHAVVPRLVRQLLQRQPKEVQNRRFTRVRLPDDHQTVTELNDLIQLQALQQDFLWVR